MTKMIRIENADTSNHKVRVIVQERNADGEWKEVGSLTLDTPTQMVSQTIWRERRLVIEEVIE